ncbi:uncharacterized protein LOC132750295 [Ruditapes philippinarum]|uniref:uncharacterized protein LOC132750295 n=1 Tax=Ruditapes philippinarum TaxID=129788 RepID=UPI00295B0B5D|nr:uncharacterized protein LOC132750295 [Ruditapes philippinarum]
MACKSALCEPCLYVDLEIEAEGFCSTCAECLCSKCIIEHKKVKLTRNHVVTRDSVPDNGDAIREMNEMLACPVHKEMKISYKCNDHMTYMCTVCRVDTHLNCEHVIEIAKCDGVLEDIHGSLAELKLSTASIKERKQENRKLLYQSQVDILSKQEIVIQKAINALEELKVKLAKDTDEKLQVAVSEIDKDTELIEVIEQRTVKNIEILEAVEKYGDSTCRKVIEHLLADDILKKRNRVKDIDKQEEYKLLFMKNEDSIQTPSLGTLSLLREERTEDKNECFELGIEKTSDEVTEIEMSSSQSENTVVTVTSSQTKDAVASNSQAGNTVVSSSQAEAAVEKCSPTKITDVNILPTQNPVGETETRSLPNISESFFFTEKNAYRIKGSTDTNRCEIYGISILPDGRLVLIDNENSNTKLLSPDYKLLDVLRLPGRPIRMCYIGENKLAVSFGLVKRINRYSVLGNTISYDGGFSTTLFNHGIGFDGKCIVAIMCGKDFSCNNDAKNDSIQIEFRNPFSGEINDVIRDFKVESNKVWSLTLRNTQAVQFIGSNVMIIAELNRILLFELREKSGKTIAVEKSFYVCKGEALKNAIDNIATGSDSIFACTSTGSVIQISASDFNSNRIVISNIGKTIRAIAVDEKNGRIILGCDEKDKILVYELRRKL